MFSLLLLFGVAQIMLAQQGSSYYIDAIQLNSSVDYLARNIAMPYFFKAYFKLGDGENETILAFTHGGSKVMLVQRSSSLLAIDHFLNEILKEVCTWTVTGDFVNYLTGYLRENIIYLELFDGSGVKYCNFFWFSRPGQKAATVYIGDPFSPGRSFTGIAALIDRGISFELVVCFRSEDNSEFSDQLSLWSGNGGYVIERIPLLEVCERQGKVVVINDNAVTGFDDIQTDYCDRLGGRYLTAIELEIVRNKILPKFEQKCRSEEGHASIKSWTANTCEIFDHSSGRTKKTCLPDHACFLCFIRNQGSLLLIKKEDDTNLFSFHNLKFLEDNHTDHFMLTSPSANITLKNKEWNLQFGDEGDEYILNNSFLPFGKQRWHSKFVNGKSHQIILVNCLFHSCDDGKCVSNEELCNGRNECKDGSDELDCDTPYLDKANYNRSRILEVGYNVSVLDVEMNAKNSSLSMELKFAFVWRDHRVVYEKRKINRFSGSKLPFNPSRDLALTDCQSETDVKLEESNSFFFIDVDEDRYKEPNFYFRQEITQWNIFNVKIELPCIINYMTFPLSDQSCSLCFRIKDNISKYELNINNLSIPNALSNTRSDFTLKTMSLTLYDESTKMKMVFHLDSSSDYFIFTIFLPYTFLVLIGYSTLFLNLNSYSERISLSASVLLALVFADVSDKFDDTSYIKLIDLFFVGCIIFTAVIVIFNVFLHYVMHHKQLTFNHIELKAYKHETSEEAIQGATIDEEAIQEATTEQEVEDEGSQSSISSKAIEAIPLERKLNMIARVVLLAFFLASMIVMFMIEK